MTMTYHQRNMYPYLRYTSVTNLTEKHTKSVFIMSDGSWCYTYFVLLCVLVFVRVILSWCPKLYISTFLQHSFFEHLFNLHHYTP